MGGFGLGAGAGALVGALLRPKTAGASEPPIDLTLVQQALATLIQQGSTTQGMLQELIDTLLLLVPTPGSPGPTPEEAVQIFNQAIRVATAVGVPLSTPLVDFRTASRLLFKVESTLDVPITVQVVGDIFETTSIRQVNVNGPLAVPAGGTITAGLAWANWHPYVGMQITVPVAPTLGLLTIYRVRKNID
jgi:hypothetical protein